MSAPLPLPPEGLDRIPVPTLALDAEGSIADANAAAAVLLGRPRAALAGAPFAALVHPDDTAALDAALDAAGTPVRLLGGDGAPRAVRLFARPADGGGALVCMTPAPDPAPDPAPPDAGRPGEVAGDRIEAVLLARALDAANNSIVVADLTQPDTPLTFVNHGFLRLTGYDADEVVGKNCRFLQVPGGGRLAPDALAAALAASRTDDEAADALRRAIEARAPVNGLVLRNYTADGRPFWNELYLTPVETEGTVTHYVGVQNDVTERVESQRRLRRQVTQLQSAFDAMPEPLGLIEGYDGGLFRHVLCNAAAAAAFELDPDTEVGLDGLGFHGASRTLWIDALREAGASGTPVVFEVPHADARTFEAVVSPAPRVAERPDVPYRYVYVAHDVTHGRRLEEDVLRISGRELTRVAQNIHDGVGQTLVGASMLASMLARTAEGRVAEDARRLHNLVRASLAQLRQFALGLDPVDIDDLGLDVALRRLAADISMLFGMEVTFRPCALPIEMPAERALDVYRIAQEAVTNAVRHGHAERVVICLDCSGPGVELVIDDDGEGISDAALADADGMGLRTMRGRARRLGGPLQVARRPRGGTRVSVRFFAAGRVTAVGPVGAA